MSNNYVHLTNVADHTVKLLVAPIIKHAPERLKNSTPKPFMLAVDDSIVKAGITAEDTNAPEVTAASEHIFIKAQELANEVLAYFKDSDYIPLLLTDVKIIQVFNQGNPLYKLFTCVESVTP